MQAKTHPQTVPSKRCRGISNSDTTKMAEFRGNANSTTAFNTEVSMDWLMNVHTTVTWFLRVTITSTMNRTTCKRPHTYFFLPATINQLHLATDTKPTSSTYQNQNQTGSKQLTRRTTWAQRTHLLLSSILFQLRTGLWTLRWLWGRHLGLLGRATVEQEGRKSFAKAASRKGFYCTANSQGKHGREKVTWLCLLITGWPPGSTSRTGSPEPALFRGQPPHYGYARGLYRGTKPTDLRTCLSASALLRI